MQTVKGTGLIADFPLIALLRVSLRFYRFVINRLVSYLKLNWGAEKVDYLRQRHQNLQAGSATSAGSRGSHH